MYSVIGTDGQVYGPVDVETLGQWSKQGRLAQDSNLIDALDGRVIRAHEVRELQPFFFVAPPVIGSGPTPVMPAAPTLRPAPQTAYAPAPQAGHTYPAPMYPQPMQQTGPQPMQMAPQPLQTPQNYPVQQAAAFQQGVPGAPSVQVNNYIALNQQTAAGLQMAPGTRNKTTAILLCLFLGSLGIHRFYLGHKGSGTTMLLITLFSAGYLSGISFIWSIVDLIGLCNNTLLDAENRALV